MIVKPKKILGQHFLHDKNIAKKIVSILKPAKTIIEVGAGTGALSKFLYEEFKESVIFFDIDKTPLKKWLYDNNYKLDAYFPGVIIYKSGQ